MSRRGILVVISGFSGVGKGTLVKELLTYCDRYALSISATTRQPREGEQDGREYFFKTREEFEKLIAADRLIEYAEYCGNYYGTPRDYVEEQLDEGRDVILEIEIQGALRVKERYPEALMVFVMPPDVATLKERLRGRGSETEETIQARLKQAVWESGYVEAYDYILVNGDLRKSAQELYSLIEAQHNTTERNADFTEQIRTELMETVKDFTQKGEE